MPLLFATEAKNIRAKKLITNAQLADYQWIPLPLNKLPLSSDWAIFSGQYNRSNDYDKLYQRVAQAGITLINAPWQSELAMEAKQHYPLLEGLTAKSWFTDHSQIDQIAKDLPYPLFVKGGLKSLKEKGADFLYANSHAELKRISQTINGAATVGHEQLIVKEKQPMRQLSYKEPNFSKKFEQKKKFYQKTTTSNPITESRTREYRLFLYHDQIIDYAFYWPGIDPFGRLFLSEKEELFSLAIEAANRLPVPYLAIDCAQLEDLSWTILEIGDPQFAQLEQVEQIQFFHKLKTLKEG